MKKISIARQKRRVLGWILIFTPIPAAVMIIGVYLAVMRITIIAEYTSVFLDKEDFLAIFLFLCFIGICMIFVGIPLGIYLLLGGRKEDKR